MEHTVLHPDISAEDRATSSRNLELLKNYVVNDSSLVFFVGAGASSAGNTGIPSTPNLLNQLLVDAVTYTNSLRTDIPSLISAIERISTRLGFEITLNDLWQICPEAITLWFKTFADFEATCHENHVHAFLAHWLFIGGTIVTTNYDRAIERQGKKANRSIQSRYQEKGMFSFESWQTDLSTGSYLFKLHGSLDDPKSCLGALEHVGTELIGCRAKLLKEIVQTRPLCFVGWRGVDPDIPMLLFDALEGRDPSLPIFWFHYEGNQPELASLQAAIQKTSPLVKPFAKEKPILTDADRAFGEILNWVGGKYQQDLERETASIRFLQVFDCCSRTGIARMVGIALRRAGERDAAERVFNAALSLATTSEEKSASLQELALLDQQRHGKNTVRARQILSGARQALSDHKPDIWLKANADFGMLSMTIVSLNSRPWLVLRIPRLFRKYRESIETLRLETTDEKSLALHVSLLNLYQGRLRFKLFGWVAILIKPMIDWILAPFDTARSTIRDAEDIHLHSKVDVLAYRAVSIAYFRRCATAIEDIDEIDRLVNILNDEARTAHWRNQRDQILQKCPQDWI